MKVKSLTLGLTTLALAVAVPAQTVFAGYAPANRATFTCITPTNCPGADYVTFNSFTNAPLYGDERPFFDLKDAGITSAGGYLDKMTVKDGQKLTLRVYVHNNANPASIGVANATAHNTKVQVILPTSKKAAHVAAANISADNANPSAISDTIDVEGALPFTLEFDTASPVNVSYRPNGTGETVTRALPGASFANAQTLNANLGEIQGCFEFINIITVTAIVKMDKPPVTPPTTPPTPVKPVAKPAELPETGAGDVAAIAAGVSLLGAVLHNRFSRRFSK